MEIADKIKIAPSLLAADFGYLADEIKKCEDGGADMIHVDVMDGRFVPNLTIGPLIVKAIRPHTTMPIACHLMITDPDRYIGDFHEAGANLVSVHVEGRIHLHRVLSTIRKYGMKAGIALNPATPLEFAYDAAEFCDYVLLMSVNPGFGGQKFIPAFLRRSQMLRNYLLKHNLEHVEIEVDGGVKIDNAEQVVRAGANTLVAGSGLFKGNLVENIKALRENAEKGLRWR